MGQISTVHFLELLFLPLNFRSSDSPRAMRVRDYLGKRGSMVNRSIARIAPQRAVQLAEIVKLSTIAPGLGCTCNTAELGRFITMTRKFHVRSG